jgi:hypothetical protein
VCVCVCERERERERERLVSLTIFVNEIRTHTHRYTAELIGFPVAHPPPPHILSLHLLIVDVLSSGVVDISI